MSVFTDLDKKILASLVEEPVASMAKLSQRVGLSSPTLERKLSDLVRRRILKESYVSAQVSNSTLGLEQVAVFSSAAPEHWPTLENACDLHPYTRYQIRCLGAVNGTFAMFAVPQGAISLLIQLFDRLKATGVITGYSMRTPIAAWLYTETDFRIYDDRAQSWKFDWDKWETLIDEGSLPFGKNPPSVFREIDGKDVKILRLLTIDARKERKAIAAQVGIPAYELSRRIKFYDVHRVIEAYRVLYDNMVLGLVTSTLIECKVSVEKAQKIAYAISRLPFQSTLVPTQEGFILQVSLPAMDFPKLVGILQKHCESVNLMWCDYTTSRRYYFDNDPSNYGNDEWIADEEYMVKSVLQKLGLA